MHSGYRANGKCEHKGGGEVRKRAYQDVQVLRDVYVSSTGHYTGAVRFVRHGQRFKYDVDLSGGLTVFGRGLNEIKLPKYVMNRIRELYLEAFEHGHNQYHEYDREGNKRYEDLRYHSQEAVNWIIECLRTDA